MRQPLLFAALGTIASATLASASGPESAEVRVGSKQFTESVVLGEMTVALLRKAGVPATHMRQLGGTRILWEALRNGQIDVYPEYTGTIAQEILAGHAEDDEAVRRALLHEGIRMSRPLGFNDSYAIGMREERAAALSIRAISDLRSHPNLQLGFSNEFMDRADGFPKLRDRYALPQEARGLDHELAYRGLASGALDATDLYSTDADIRYYGLRVLDDDLHHFPRYDAVLLYRDELRAGSPDALAALSRMEGLIPQESMVEMNARAKLDKVPEAQVAADFLATHLHVETPVLRESVAARAARHTCEHLLLVSVSLASAILVAVPLGVLCARRPLLGQVILGVAGVVQTVPTLALLVFMIPLLGIGERPAIAALFLYSLLPIVRNTHAGLSDIPAALRESAEALGLPPAAQLRLVEIPMASRAILAGIKTSAVINVGTATLGALIGAGGYGQPILTGIRLNDVGLILQGAVPAAALALSVQGLFDLSERVLVPRGLRLKAR